ncbi:MAG TPA: efflux RND transporter periplasmic adaptor subunit [Xanthobacteraceae bacterium]|nr:efflux RND transporter periplasmic adaptor subunit [Xanthobacteraceae bacterium]
MRLTLIASLSIGMAFIQAANAAESYLVKPAPVPDQKAVFATVESRRVVPARARIAGIVADLAVKEGDHVELGQVVATVGDEKLVLQMKSLDAQIAGLEAQVTQAQTDLTRAEELVGRGTIPRVRLDEARTAFNVASNALRSRQAERSVVQQQFTEGNVLAPAAGRVLRVPLTSGAVVMAGEPLAEIAEQNFVLRLRVPERHARFLKAGDTVRVDAAELGDTEPRFGTITLVYPRIEDGRVVADAKVEGLGDYFVSERIRVWISAGERLAFVVPASFVTTRFGVDYVKVQANPNEPAIDVPVQRGRELPRTDLPDGIEILSGLKPGDRLVKP